MAQKQYTVCCPKCQTYTVTKPGLFNKWPKITCASAACQHVYSMEDVRRQQVTCEHCERSVEYDLLLENDCPNCKHPLNVGNELLWIGCPSCTLPVSYRRGDKLAVCPNPKCQKRFNPTQEATVRSSTMMNNAPDVQMADEMPADHLIWRHPLREWAINTCVQPAPGMYAVGIKGDEEKFLVTGTSMNLSDTVLRNEVANYSGASVPMVQVDIFYVRRNINKQIRWGGKITVPTVSGTIMEYGVSGSLYINHITNPAKFMRSFGFEPDQVLLSEFGVDDKQCPRGMAKKVQVCVNGVLETAMRNVRRDRNCMGNDMEHNKKEFLEETLRLANAELEAYGLCVSDLTGEYTNKGLALLWRRLTGMISWNLSRPVTVHPWDESLATADLSVSGKVNVEIVNYDRLSTCAEAAEWGEPEKDDGIVSRAITDMVHAQLRDYLPSVLQQIIISNRCNPDMLGYFNSNIVAMANDKLNEMYGYFQSRGLRVQVSGVEIRMSNKSREYLAYEALAHELQDQERQKILANAQTQTTDVVEENKRRQLEQTTATTVHGVYQQDRIAKAEYEVAMAQGERQSDLNRLERRLDYEALQDEHRAEDAQDIHDLGRKNRVAQNDRNNRLADMELEEQLIGVAARIESSKLGIREKLDAYARLQRQLDFQDHMNERDVQSEAETREARMRTVLRAEDMRTMNELKYEESCRALELRQQLLEQEAQRLKTEFENERVIAAEQEARQQAREEIEVLRLMLEYLTVQGDQQVTLESLREAREEARLTRQREQDAAERKAAEAREARRNSAEKEMADRAMKILESLAGLQQDAESLGREYGKATKDVGALKTIIRELNEICDAVKAGWRRQPENTGAQSWFDNLTARAPRRGSTKVYDFPTPRNVVLCGRCGKRYGTNLFRCPECGLPR